MGLKDSVKPDLYNKNTGQVFDYKFGDAKLETQQISNLQKHMPKTQTHAPVSRVATPFFTNFVPSSLL